jgi:DNA-directed RNA polymerase subunit RPC12/RpoP
MKSCGYCGKENDDTAMQCTECGSQLIVETRGKIADAMRWTPKSALGIAFTSGLAALLICTGIFFTIGRFMRDILRMHGAGNAGVPANYDVVMFYHPAITWTIFSLAALFFIFFTCYDHCVKQSHGIITAITTICITALLTIGPLFLPGLFPFLWFLPAVLIGMSTGLSVGYYIGAAVQVFAGAWLLGWFGRKRNNNEQTA